MGDFWESWMKVGPFYAIEEALTDAYYNAKLKAADVEFEMWKKKHEKDNQDKPKEGSDNSMNNDNMELHLEQGYVSVNECKVYVNGLKDIGYISVDILDDKWRYNITGRRIETTFLYLEGKDCYFFYSDEEAFDALVRDLAKYKRILYDYLCKYNTDYCPERNLWKQLLKYICERFDINKAEYRTFDGKINYDSDYYSFEKIMQSPQRVASLEHIHEFLSMVLPQNYAKTERQYRLYKIEEVLFRYKEICGKDFKNRDNYIKKLDEENGDNTDKWESSYNIMERLSAELQEKNIKEIYDHQSSDAVFSFIDYVMEYINGKLDELYENQLLQEYGPISVLKKNLRDDISRLDFMDLLSLYKEYKNQESYLCSKARSVNMDEDEYPFKEYIDIYRLGSVLISDRMNHISRNKTKNKYIPQELLDEAMVFYYEAQSPKEAYSVRSDEKYAQDKESGNAGEEKVEYALKWLDKSYIQIEKRSKDKVGNSCILIENPEFIDEPQEYDHIIVSGKGVFCIETKNYSGKLIIDQYGNWIRKRDNEEEGVKNPLQQIRQHEKLLSSVLPKGISITSIICIANDKAVIEGNENCTIPIVKSDMLVEYIENYKADGTGLSESDIDNCTKAIYEHMV